MVLLFASFLAAPVGANDSENFDLFEGTAEGYVDGLSLEELEAPPGLDSSGTGSRRADRCVKCLKN